MNDEATFDALTPLRSSVVFGNLDEATMERIATSLTPVDLEAGDILMEEGDGAGDAWITVTGRLRVWATQDGSREVLAELGPGSLVGEMSLLTGADRSATVEAVRDSRLLRLPAAEFNRIVLEDSAVLLQVARTLVRRLDRSIHNHHGTARPTVLGIIPAGRRPDHRSFVREFASAPGQPLTVAMIDRAHIDEAIGPKASDAELVAHLHRMEAHHDLTLLVGDEDDTAWTRKCVQHADLNLLVGHESGLSTIAAAEAALTMDAPTKRLVDTHLVILSNGGIRTPAASHLSLRAVDRHHHVRDWYSADLLRLARVVSRTTVGLVLGGGGARGFAHLGVIKAIQEAGVPVDHVGGSSIGAVVAGIYAMGWEWDEMVAKARMATVDRGSLIDFSFPAVALASGEKLKSSIHDLFGDLDIEDLALDYFCASTDLTNGELHVHTVGPMWQAVRSSVAIPGIFPPVQGSDGRVLVDGGVLNNLPTDVMRHLYEPDTLIASNVQGSTQLPFEDLGNDGVVSGWGVVGRRYLSRNNAMEVPRMVDILTSASAVTGHHGAELADYVFQPPVEPYAILDFKSNAAILEAGYHYAVERLEAWNLPIATPAAPR